MELFEKKTGRKVNVRMYIIDMTDEPSYDISNDFFNGFTVVEDIDYCIDQVKDWVNAIGDFREEDCKEMRLAIIDDELFANYKI